VRIAEAAHTAEQHRNPDKRDGIYADGHEGKFIARRMDRVAADDRPGLHHRTTGYRDDEHGRCAERRDDEGKIGSRETKR